MSARIESLFNNALKINQQSLMNNIRLCEKELIRFKNLRLSHSNEILEIFDETNIILNNALHYIKKDFIPFRNFLFHLGEIFTFTNSEFDYHCNQGLIGLILLEKHVEKKAIIVIVNLRKILINIYVWIQILAIIIMFIRFFVFFM